MLESAKQLNDIAQLLPTVFIEQITLDSKFYNTQDGNFKENLVLNVSLSLKDVVDKDGISQWFFENELDFKKYIRVHPLVMTSKDFFNSLYTVFTGDYDYNFLKIFTESTSGVTEIKGVEIPTKEELKKDIGTMFTENYIADNDDGTKEVTVPLKFKHELVFDQDKDKFLSILVFLTFDLKAFANALGIQDISVTEENALSRNFTSQIIIDNGELVSESKYFKLPDGSFYYGQFHVITEGFEFKYKTGVIETEDSVELELVTDKNYIINDFRLRKKLEYKDQFDINGSVDITETQKLDTTAAINNVFKSDLQIKKILEKTKSNKKEFSKYFSDTMISLDEQGNCRFSFFFDKKNFGIDNSFYPIIFQNDPNAVAEKIKVKNIKVFRIRKEIKEINDSSENIPILVAQNGTDKNFTIDILQAPNLTIFNGSYIVENNIEGVDSLSIRSYSVCDTYVSKINYGLYKYKVVIEIEDLTSEYLLERLNSLINIRSVMQEYYNISLTGKKISDGVIGDAKQNKVKYVPYFDVMLGKFITDFSKEQTAIINNAIFSFDKFLNVSKELGYYSPNNLDEWSKFKKMILNLLQPPAATPESIGILVSLVADITDKLQNLLAIPDTQKASKVSSKYANNLITVDYTFENSSMQNIENTIVYDINKSYDSYFNAAVINGVGYKVVNGASDALNLGLDSIKLADYKNLADLVVEKYFEKYTTLNLKDIYGENLTETYNFIDEFENDDSKFGYLPVSVVNTIDKKYSVSRLSDQFYNQEYFESMFLDILNYNILKQTNFSNQESAENSTISKDQQVIKAQLLEIFSNPTIANISIAAQEPTKASEISKKQSFFNSLGTAGPFNTNILDKQVSSNKNVLITSTSDINAQPNSLLLEILLHELVNNLSDLRNLKDYSIFTPVDENENKNSKFFIDKFISLVIQFYGGAKVPDTVIRKYIKDLPVPIKHLLISRGNTLGIVKAYEDANNVKDATIYPENFFKYWINFKNLYKVEYLANFEGGNNLKSPNWQPLTINKLTNSTGNILCRIQTHKLPFFNEYFPDVQKLEMPLFDKYFYIIPDNSVNLLTSIQNAVQQLPKPLPPIEVQEANPPPDKIGPISILDAVANIVDLVANTSNILGSIEVLQVESPQQMVGLIATIPEDKTVGATKQETVVTTTPSPAAASAAPESPPPPKTEITKPTSLADLVTKSAVDSGGLPQGTGGNNSSSGNSKNSQSSNNNSFSSLDEKKKKLAEKLKKLKA